MQRTEGSMTRLPSTKTAWRDVTAKSCISTGRSNGTATLCVMQPEASAEPNTHSMLPDRASAPKKSSSPVSA